MALYGIIIISTSTQPYLDSLVKVFLEVGGVHNSVLDGLSAVEDEFVLNLLLGSSLHRLLLRYDHHFLGGGKVSYVFVYN